jgi:hypothetical protein
MAKLEEIVLEHFVRFREGMLEHTQLIEYIIYIYLFIFLCVFVCVYVYNIGCLLRYANVHEF